MSLRYAVWCFGLGTVQTPHLPENTPFDYTAQSPISGKSKHYDEQEVQKELSLIVKETEFISMLPFSVVSNIFTTLPFKLICAEIPLLATLKTSLPSSIDLNIE